MYKYIKAQNRLNHKKEGKIMKYIKIHPQWKDIRVEFFKFALKTVIHLGAWVTFLQSSLLLIVFSIFINLLRNMCQKLLA